MKKKIKTADLAVHLAGGKPLAVHLREDGSLVVIGPEGRKQIFTASEVRAARKTAASAVDQA